MGAMSVREECRHYLAQSVGRHELLERCRVSAAEVLPFSCPEGCLFYEPSAVSRAGWRGVPPRRGGGEPGR